ncbi:uncharacterized protein LOC117171158 [Belonocnema kinseyi]|uniref:uncharacterized protein LOC117171158 n=1 Tax=Belonocnema kinseyi TaxID=2817044 RepID=UPI00143DAF31|nr:uncharacterized protein LOC117171158 [Belonocnema kinseyi]
MKILIRTLLLIYAVSINFRELGAISGNPTIQRNIRYGNKEIGVWISRPPGNASKEALRFVILLSKASRLRCTSKINRMETYWGLQLPRGFNYSRGDAILIL